jgi:metal-responsive CopG/Arc/MetJ family transcriptional regulator
MKSERVEITLEPELLDRLDKYCTKHKISKSKLAERLFRTILNNTETKEAEENLYLMWIESGLTDIVKKIAQQNAEIESLRTEVRDALKGLKK